MGSVADQNPNELSGWKNICRYLGYSIRHCNRLEKEGGLPIYRRKGSNKPTVIAYIDELEDWKAKNIIAKEPAGTNSTRTFRIKWPVIVFPALIFLALIIFAIGRPRAGSIQPASIHVVRSMIVASDEEGRSIWKYDTKIANLWIDEIYQKRAYHRKYDDVRWGASTTFPPLIKLEDLDGDKNHEVLFAIKTGDEHGEGKLLCLDHSGDLIWERAAGKQILCGGTEYPEDFVIWGIDTADLDHDGRMEIVIISHALMQWPTQVLVLSSSGQKIGEYWNSGQINDFVCGDINQDGCEEIILAGQNEEFHKPALIVLNGSRIEGASPNSDSHRCGRPQKGSELFYILLPQTEIDEKLPGQTTLDKVEILKDSSIQVMTNKSGTYYTFDKSLRLKKIDFGDYFKTVNRDLAGNGTISAPLNLAETEKSLKTGLRYWEGASKRWNGEWAKANPADTVFPRDE